MMYEAITIWLATRTAVDLAEAVFVGFSVVGQHFISERDKAGFYYWGVGNVVAIGTFAYTGRWLTAGLYVYFLVKCVTGLRSWHRLQLIESESMRAALAAHSQSQPVHPQLRSVPQRRSASA
jgi:nicotinamide riboside transporter PnuC